MSAGSKILVTDYRLEGEKIKAVEKPWTFKDDQGKESYSLLAPPVVVSLICQLKEALGI